MPHRELHSDTYRLLRSAVPSYLPFLVGLSCLSCAGTEPEAQPPRLEKIPDEYREPEGAPGQKNAPPVAGQTGVPTIVPRDLASCGETADGFDGWLMSFRQHALEHGISTRTLERTLTGTTYHPYVIELDRSQTAFHLTFEQFAASRVTRARISRGKQLLKSHAALLSSIESRFGVPPRILMAIWGLETDFGDNSGTMSPFRSLATLAYDCRRSERFRSELLSALRIVERGDLSPNAMLGAWAGELGQTQFLPSSYERFAIDFDGDGRADLIRSTPDALASTANYLQGNGWNAGEGFKDGSPNFTVLASWNRSPLYRKTIVLFASKL